MASYVVSGAGSTSYNGTYDEDGTVNGYAKYTKQGGGAVLFQASDMPPPMGTWTWRLYTSTQGISPAVGAAYYKTASSGITGTYTKGNQGNNPVPTVTEAPATAVGTVYGLAKASVATVDDLAIASVGTVNGLA